MKNYPYIAAIFLILLTIIGWINNIVQLFQLESLSGELVVRAVGIIVFPLGAVMGYI
jgi:hypothetical protein